MPGRINGFSLAYTAVGGVVLWSGIKGTTISDTFRGLPGARPLRDCDNPLFAGGTADLDVGPLPSGQSAGRPVDGLHRGGDRYRLGRAGHADRAGQLRDRQCWQLRWQSLHAGGQRPHCTLSGHIHADGRRDWAARPDRDLQRRFRLRGQQRSHDGGGGAGRDEDQDPLPAKTGRGRGLDGLHGDGDRSSPGRSGATERPRDVRFEQARDVHRGFVHAVYDRRISSCRVSYTPAVGGAHELSASYSGDSANAGSRGRTILPVRCARGGPRSADRRGCSP